MLRPLPSRLSRPPTSRRGSQGRGPLRVWNEARGWLRSLAELGLGPWQGRGGGRLDTGCGQGGRPSPSAGRGAPGQCREPRMAARTAPGGTRAGRSWTWTVPCPFVRDSQLDLRPGRCPGLARDRPQLFQRPRPGGCGPRRPGCRLLRGHLCGPSPSKSPPRNVPQMPWGVTGVPGDGAGRWQKVSLCL